ncbi:unnamed protein product [Dibothriocephalus latus]|uniref:Uncharacterized protein n=1 Tax=Dibothriocephalus latus TaxID=60516 RepID=A0A3P7RKG1_DIBLA|nr:unnamed protein product [Dibothriocephalus latus]
MGIAIEWRQRAYDIKMNMAESSVEAGKSAGCRLIVAMNLTPLATRAGAGPSFDILVQARPDEPFREEFL